MLNSWGPPSPLPPSAPADRRRAPWKQALGSDTAPAMSSPLIGCGHEGHEPECLCDVVVTDPVEILNVNHACDGHSWQAGRVFRSLGFSPFKPWTPDRILDFFEAQVELHDKVQSALNPPPPDYWDLQQALADQGRHARGMREKRVCPSPPRGTMTWQEYAAWVFRTEGPYRYMAEEVADAVLAHYKGPAGPRTRPIRTLKRIRSAVLAAGRPA